jgi:hypothetical protein
MKNADPAVIEFITARSANYPVAGTPHTFATRIMRPLLPAGQSGTCGRYPLR